MVESSLPYYLANFLNGSIYTRKFFPAIGAKKAAHFHFFSSSLCTWDARIVPLAPLSWAIFSPVVMCFRLNSNTKRLPQLLCLGSTCTLIKQTSCRKFCENTTHILKIVTHWSVIHQNWMLSGPTCFLENRESWYSLIRRRSEGDLEREVAKQGPLPSESTNVWNKSIARCKIRDNRLPPRERGICILHQQTGVTILTVCVRLSPAALGSDQYGLTWACSDPPQASWKFAALMHLEASGSAYPWGHLKQLRYECSFHCMLSIVVQCSS